MLQIFKQMKFVFNNEICFLLPFLTNSCIVQNTFNFVNFWSIKTCCTIQVVCSLIMVYLSDISQQITKNNFIFMQSTSSHIVKSSSENKQFHNCSELVLTCWMQIVRSFLQRDKYILLRPMGVSMSPIINPDHIFPIPD